MSEALENNEGSKKSEEAPCVKCKVRHENNNFDSMCSSCLNKTKIHAQKNSKMPEPKVEDQANYTTPTKKLSEEMAALRYKQLIEAPRKPCIKRFESFNTDEKEKNEDSSIHYMHRKESISEKSEDLQRNEYQNLTQKKQEILKVTPIKHKTDVSNTIQQAKNSKVVVANKKRAVRVRQDIVQLKDEQIQSKKRTYEQFIGKSQSLEIKGKCNICKRKTGLLGTCCSHCDQEYCNAHRLPQNHQCKVNFAEQAKKARREVLISILPKHKGKISEI